MKKRILVCDDEEPIRLLITETLKDNYNIEHAADGREALRLVTKEDFNLLIVDIKMPGIHGLEQTSSHYRLFRISLDGR
jgi:two-component system response regulator (stage 0 sporulation protein F)